MPRAAGAREPSCVVCGESLRYGELTVFLRDALAHHHCYTAPADATDRVVEFLRQRSTGTYCNLCIGAMCGIRHHEVSTAATNLRARADFRIVLGARCAGCHHVRITIGVSDAPGGPGADG
jgi:hypothetical protein